MFSLLHYRLSDANQSDSSGEEQELQVQLLPAGGVSSKESIRTAVSERGHRLVCINYTYAVRAVCMRMVPSVDLLVNNAGM